jgi:serine/threonine protein kinase/Tol biopolymer transport system component
VFFPWRRNYMSADIITARMTLSAGARLGPYEITGALGAGGMGEVYRARDTHLNRDVAIKVLPELFARDPDRLARFTREAQALASVNHPNIAAIYGVEMSSAVPALIMELVEGDDLSTVIAQGPMALAEALPIGRQIADALDAAHEQGIIHRDLKPANIKVRPDGTVKVLDFGLAKAMDPAASNLNAMHSPTLTARATRMGVILGTAAYMSPEQARGRTVDKRADIWAFGVVLFEMITGRRVFAGDEMSDILARILERDPDWSGLPGSTPPAVRRLLERCLTKDPKARLRDIGEARHTLDEAIAGRSASPLLQSTANGETPPKGDARSRPARRLAPLLPWLVAAAFAAVAGAAWLRPAPAASGAVAPVRVELSLPDNVEFYTSPRISPDGRRVAFVGVREGSRQVYLRNLDQDEAHAVAGTDGCIFVAFSPDSQSIAVITTDARLKRVSLDAGGVEDLASGVDVVGGLNWTPDGRILFGRVTQLLSVPATGGAPKVVVGIDTAAGETTIVSPVATPDGRTVLFTSWTGAAGALQARIEAVAMDGGPRRVVVDDAGYVIAARSDRLLFQRDTSIYSVPFDAARAIATGTATKLTGEARPSPTGGISADVSPSGDLVFADTRTFNGRLTWVSLDGVERAISVPARVYNNPRVSPDGRTVAYSDAAAIWTTDTERGAQSRIFSGSDSLTGFPVWSADGSHLFFRTSSGVVRMRADGEGQPERVAGSLRSDYPNAVSPDGTLLVLTRISAATSGDVALLPVKGGEPRIVVATPAYDGGAQFSPDGKWLTYVSNSSGRMEVYLRPVEGPERYSVSTAGGLGALWSRDGRRIFFRNGHQFLSVDVTTNPTVTLSAPKLLFERRYAFGQNITIANYSMSHDGREFLVVNTGTGHLTLILNWLQTPAKPGAP